MGGVLILSKSFILKDNSAISQLIANSLIGLEEDETLVDKAVEQHVFGFVKNVIVSHEKFHFEAS